MPIGRRHELVCAPDIPRLPEMPPIVGGDDVQSGGEAEPDTADERIRKVHPRQIEVCVGTKERAHLVLRQEKAVEGVGQWR